MEDPTGHFPDRFSELRLIGRGSQGETWRAFDRTTDRVVAIKVVTLGAGMKWKAFELFERECATLQNLDHAGIPRYYEHFADEERGRYYLVMEYVDGDSLAKGIGVGRRRSEAELSGLLLNALEIVEYLHGLRPAVIHRDIKPGNLIERPDGSLVLVDFGGVTDALRSKGGSTMIGTFGYMAPEQLYGRVSPATDLYGLGATIASVASGLEGEDLPRSGMEIDVDAIVADPQLRAALRSMTRADAQRRSATSADVRVLLAPPNPPSEHGRNPSSPPATRAAAAVARRKPGAWRRIAPFANVARTLMSRGPDTAAPRLEFVAAMAMVGYLVGGGGFGFVVALTLGVVIPFIRGVQRGQNE